jgi:hypothetical protein
LATLEEARENRKQAKKEYKNIIKTAQELRQKELEIKAEENKQAGQTKNAVMIKVILDRERLRLEYRYL